jgi:hypothetical protein
MEYSKYIELGFERIDMNDSFEQKKTGYSGYSLNKQITDRILIEVYWSELETPKMYIKKLNSETCHIINITPEMVVDLCSEKSYPVDKNSIYTAC